MSIDDKNDEFKNWPEPRKVKGYHPLFDNTKDHNKKIVRERDVLMKELLRLLENDLPQEMDDKKTILKRQINSQKSISTEDIKSLITELKKLNPQKAKNKFSP